MLYHNKHELLSLINFSSEKKNRAFSLDEVMTLHGTVYPQNGLVLKGIRDSIHTSFAEANSKRAGPHFNIKISYHLILLVWATPMLKERRLVRRLSVNMGVVHTGKMVSLY